MPKREKRPITSSDQAMRELVKLYTSNSKHGTYRIFSDFLTLSACALSNSVDLAQREQREALYMQTIKGYSKDEADRFAHMLGLVVQGFEPVPGQVEYRDMLGELYMQLELGNEWAGQFFTPYSVALMKALMVMGDRASWQAEIARRGFIRASDPCVGGGALVIAMADAMMREGINFQQHLHCTCIDVDFKAVCMAYVQLSLLHVPAVILHGNALSNEMWSVWYTPAHVLGLWSARLRRQDEERDGLHAVATIELCEPSPVPPAIALEDVPLDAPQLTLF